MYLIIPELILQSRKLSGDQKIILSLLIVLQQQGRFLFASELWFLENLGIKNGVEILHGLEELGHCERTKQGWRLTNEAMFKLKGSR